MFTSLICVYIFFLSLSVCRQAVGVARMSIKHFCLGTTRGFVISHENLTLRIQLLEPRQAVHDWYPSVVFSIS